jgi:hypothetical protein
MLFMVVKPASSSSPCSGRRSGDVYLTAFQETEAQKARFSDFFQLIMLFIHFDHHPMCLPLPAEYGSEAFYNDIANLFDSDANDPW